MRVYIPFKRDRAMVAFVESEGVVYLAEGKKLPSVPKHKRIVVPLYTIEDIASRFPGLAQEINEYSVIASAASEAEKLYKDFRLYLIREACATANIPVRQSKAGLSELSQSLINTQYKRLRVFTEGGDNVFVISFVREHSRSESMRGGGWRVMFIRTAFPEKKTTDFERFSRGWSIYVPSELPPEEPSAVWCPIEFVRAYEEAYQESQRLVAAREQKGETITTVYSSVGEMAVETDRGFFVMYSVGPTVVSAYQRAASIRVTFVRSKQKEKEESEDEEKG